jgi:hypothetical protein
LQDGGRHYNQIIRNIDIDLGHENPGAIGIRHQGAEGCAIQHVKINAPSGFAGLYGAPSSGGLMTGVEVVGARYGIYIPDARGGAQTIAGLRLSGQWDQPIMAAHRYPLIIVGFDVTHDNGPVATPRQNGSDASGHLTLVDGAISLTGGGTAAAIENSDRSIYLQNVYVKGTPSIVDNQADGSVLPASSPDRWTRVEEYAYVDGARGISALVNGAFDNFTAQVTGVIDSVPTDLVTRHVFPSDLCDLSDPGMFDVTDAGAVGDGVSDDTFALQAAIDQADKVFLPKGRYMVSGTLELGPDTQLCGAANVLSVIVADPTWSEPDFMPLLRRKGRLRPSPAVGSSSCGIRGTFA